MVADASSIFTGRAAPTTQSAIHAAQRAKNLLNYRSFGIMPGRPIYRPASKAMLLTPGVTETVLRCRFLAVCSRPLLIFSKIDPTASPTSFASDLSARMTVTLPLIAAKAARSATTPVNIAPSKKQTSEPLPLRRFHVLYLGNSRWLRAAVRVLYGAARAAVMPQAPPPLRRRATLQ